jgi:seryl-tRNA synthetase
MLMLNPRMIRENPDTVRDALRRRFTSAPLDEILTLDEERRAVLVDVEALRARRNQVSAEIGRDRERLPELRLEMRRVGDEIKLLEEKLGAIDSSLADLVLQLPNIPDPSVPIGEEESANTEVRRWGTQRHFSFQPRPHWDIGEGLGMLDFERGTKISGPRSWVLKGQLSRLNRALSAWMLDVHVADHGYTEVATPYLVRPECMVGAGQLPKFADESYKLANDDFYLIPTAEVPVTNLFREEIIEPASLPIRYVAYSACFRREAGAAGRDTRGLIRVHQFEKVEMVTFAEPSTSSDELERLLGDAEDILRRLDLPYRVILKGTGDLGFHATKTYDPEVWLPGQDRFVEISSCSSFGDFQARRANIRYRPEAGARPEFVHTLNGSGLAIGRTLVAILENYQQEDGSVVVPEVLRSYVGGLEVIRPS